MGTHHRTAIASGLLFTVIGAIGLGACVSDTAEMPPIPDGSTPTSTTPPPPLPELDAAADATDAADAAIPPLPPPPPPKQDEVTEQFGIFVAANGAPGAAGTRAAPVSTISEGITLAKAAKKRVYVCAGTYTEALELLPGVSIVGNMDCATDPTKWTISQANALVASPTSPAITARDINVPTRIDGLDVIAPAGNDTEQSSIGLLAFNSTGLTFVGGKIEAQRGANGKNAPVPEGFTLRVDRAPDGGRFPVSCVIGAASVPCSDTTLTTPLNISLARPSAGVGQGGKITCMLGGAAFFDSTGGNGGEGRLLGAGIEIRAARPGTAGTPAATPATPTPGKSSSGGAFDANGYGPGSGEKGNQVVVASAAGSGGPGQSDNVGQYNIGSSGAGGGAGGCPGRSADGGFGGGASVAVLSTRSPLRFEKMILKAAAGGNGGEGNFGAAATPGQAAIENGMSGANGVPASPSGHGAGGPSIAIVHDGTVPTQVQCQLSHGTAGSSPPARVQGGFTINEAAPALAQDVFKY
ncbi:MAG: hypothetical protein U0183_11555 [Polyangiaceae bacterium]